MHKNTCLELTIQDSRVWIFQNFIVLGRSSPTVGEHRLGYGGTPADFFEVIIIPLQIFFFLLEIVKNDKNITPLILLSDEMKDK